MSDVIDRVMTFTCYLHHLCRNRSTLTCVPCYWRRLRHSSGPQSGRDSWCSSAHSERPGNSAEAAADDAAPNRHIAKSHDDTTEGAVHCFQDEFGVYISLFSCEFIL